MELQLIILISAILFIAGFVRATFGFADALIAMPLLALVIEVKLATPIVAVYSSVIAAYIFFKDNNEILFKELKWLIIATIAGIPLGVYFLTEAHETLIKVILGVVITGFAVFKLTDHFDISLKSKRSAAVFGFFAGILGGAYNTNGPPIIIYGTLRNWSPTKFRATLQGIFLPVNTFIVINHGVAGLWTEQFGRLLLYTFPVMITAFILENLLHKRIDPQKYTRIIYFLLLLIGLSMLAFNVF